MVRNGRLARFGLLAAVPVVAFGVVQLFAQFEFIAAMMGRDASATGRIPLWSSVLSDVMAAPFLGWGYGAYWHGVESRIGRIDREIGFTVTHAHNGYLELALSFGVIISLVIVAGMGIRFLRYLRRRAQSDVEASIAVAIVSFLFTFNMTESALFTTGGGFWLSFLVLWMHMRGRQRAAVTVQRNTPTVNPAFAITKLVSQA
jgi:O-antigen ligase